MNNKELTLVELLVAVLAFTIVAIISYKTGYEDKECAHENETISQSADELAGDLAHLHDTVFLDKMLTKETVGTPVIFSAEVNKLMSVNAGVLKNINYRTLPRPIAVAGDFCGDHKDEVIFIDMNGTVTLFWIK